MARTNRDDDLNLIAKPIELPRGSLEWLKSPYLRRKSAYTDLAGVIFYAVDSTGEKAVPSDGFKSLCQLCLSLVPKGVPEDVLSMSVPHIEGIVKASSFVHSGSGIQGFVDLHREVYAKVFPTVSHLIATVLLVVAIPFTVELGADVTTGFLNKRASHPYPDRLTSSDEPIELALLRLSNGGLWEIFDAIEPGMDIRGPDVMKSMDSLGADIARAVKFARDAGRNTSSVYPQVCEIVFEQVVQKAKAVNRILKGDLKHYSESDTQLISEGIDLILRNDLLGESYTVIARSLGHMGKDAAVFANELRSKKSKVRRFLFGNADAISRCETLHDSPDVRRSLLVSSIMCRDMFRRIAVQNVGE